MRKLNVTPEEMKAVCGLMVAPRAADHLGLTLAQFYYLAQKYSLSTACTKQLWSPQDEETLAQLYRDGYLQKDIAEMMGRGYTAVRSRVTQLRKRDMNMRKAA
ncbi:sigma-70 family RNA polymerase sigma factor [Enterobacter roggenkampii]|uniref:sigma-70 family RNA polymerase sigma factor n=1 Tax=Enterobacter roggenkampii TaxID=1812935 RepID=UPI0032AFB2C2